MNKGKTETVIYVMREKQRVPQTPMSGLLPHDFNPSLLFFGENHNYKGQFIPHTQPDPGLSSICVRISWSRGSLVLWGKPQLWRVRQNKFPALREVRKVPLSCKTTLRPKCVVVNKSRKREEHSWQREQHVLRPWSKRMAN